MRYALVINMLLWFIHNAYVQAYPSAIACIVLCFWTILQIIKKSTIVLFFLFYRLLLFNKLSSDFHKFFGTGFFKFGIILPHQLIKLLTQSHT